MDPNRSEQRANTNTGSTEDADVGFTFLYSFTFTCLQKHLHFLFLCYSLHFHLLFFYDDSNKPHQQQLTMRSFGSIRLQDILKHRQENWENKRRPDPTRQSRIWMWPYLGWVLGPQKEVDPWRPLKGSTIHVSKKAGLLHSGLGLKTDMTL